MNQSSRSRLVAGVLLILAGLVFLVAQLVPGFKALLGPLTDWPMIIIAIGAMMLVLGLVGGVPDMAVPATIVAGIGGILAYQWSSGNWESWSYLWTLIPGFVGIGVIISGLIKGEGWRALRNGGNLLVVSLVMLVIFSAIFTAIFGQQNNMGVILPAALIVVGLVMLIRSLLRKP